MLVQRERLKATLFTTILMTYEMMGLLQVACVHVLLSRIWVDTTRKKVVFSSEYLVWARQGKT